MKRESVVERDTPEIFEEETDPAALVHAVIDRVGWEIDNGAVGFRATDTEWTEVISQTASTLTEESPQALAATSRIPPTSPQPPALESKPSVPEKIDRRRSMGRSKHGTLENLRAHIGDCTRCPLHGRRAHIVFGEGNPKARLVFVGEGPGRDEDLQGRPFVGAAGQLLDKIIGAMGLDRTDVYICNVVKCRPPQNRVPSEQEQHTCGVYLKHQLAIIRPEVIVTLGATPARYLLDVDEPVGRLRGRFHDLLGIAVMPTYHPAYLLRNPQAKKSVWNDMQMVLRQLGLPIAGKKTR